MCTNSNGYIARYYLTQIVYVRMYVAIAVTHNDTRILPITMAHTYHAYTSQSIIIAEEWLLRVCLPALFRDNLCIAETFSMRKVYFTKLLEDVQKIRKPYVHFYSDPYY